MMALTIRPTIEFNEALEKIKERQGLSAASKVIDLTVLSYLNQKKIIEDLTEQLRVTEIKYSELKNLIKKSFQYESEIKKIVL